MADFDVFSKQSKQAASALTQELKLIGADREADLLSKATAVLSIMSGTVGIIQFASTAIASWSSIQAALAAVKTAEYAALPPMWPVIGAAVAGAAIAGGVTATVMASKTIRADLSTDEGRAVAVAGVREAMA
jgi:hypothetical protein